MIASLSRRNTLLALSGIVSLAGCSVLPSPPASQIYRLSPQAEDPPHAPTVRKQLVVDIPTASASLDTDRIALIRGRTRFDYYASARWTDRVPVMIQTLLIAAFETDGRIAQVGRDAESLTPDYSLQIDVRQFEARYAGSDDTPPSAVVSLDLDVVKMPDHQMIGHTLITEAAMATRNDVESAVEAFDAATAKVLARCVAWTTDAIGRGV